MTLHAHLAANDACRLAHRVAVFLEDRQPIATVATVLTQPPWNMDYRQAWEGVGAAIRETTERNTNR